MQPPKGHGQSPASKFIYWYGVGEPTIYKV